MTLDFLNLTLVHTLSVVLDEGSFRSAAEVLHVSPSAVTQQIRRLEDAVGYPLLVRDSTPLRLTPRGREFMLHAREALDASAHALGTATAQRLRLGFIEGYPRSPDEDFLNRFRTQNPGIKLEFVQLGWGEQTSGLLSGEVDAALIRPPVPAGLPIDIATVFREPRVVGVEAGSPLADHGSVLFEELSGLPVARARGVPREWTDYWAVDPRPDGTAAPDGPWISTIEEALSAVTMDGAVFITAKSVGERFSHPGVRFLPVDDLSWCEVVLCTRHGDRRSAVRELRRAAEGSGTRPGHRR